MYLLGSLHMMIGFARPLRDRCGQLDEPESTDIDLLNRIAHLTTAKTRSHLSRSNVEWSDRSNPHQCKRTSHTTIAIYRTTTWELLYVYSYNARPITYFQREQIHLCTTHPPVMKTSYYHSSPEEFHSHWYSEAPQSRSTDMVCSEIYWKAYSKSLQIPCEWQSQSISAGLQSE